MSEDATRAFWSRRFAEKGPRIEALWGSEESQRARFEAFLRTKCFARGSHVLDVGCGFGDFYGYLRERDVPVGSYLGVDLMPEAIEEAEARYPDAEFVAGDWREVPMVPPPTVVCASGIFGLAVPGWEQYVQATLRAMHERAYDAVVVNFLSSQAPTKSPEAKFADPGTVLEWALACTPRVQLLHDYRANDFTVVLRKP